MEKQQEVSTQAAENTASTAKAATVDKEDNKVILMTSREYEEAKLAQRLPVGAVAGLIAGAVCAVLWAVITVLTNYQIGYMAIAVGVAVGFAVRAAGKGITPVFGYVGAAIALISCICGNFLSVVGYLAHVFNVSYTDVFSLVDFEFIKNAMTESFRVMDIVFYALAIGAGYQFAVKKVKVVD